MKQRFKLNETFNTRHLIAIIYHKNWTFLMVTSSDFKTASITAQVQFPPRLIYNPEPKLVVVIRRSFPFLRIYCPHCSVVQPDVIDSNAFSSA